MSAEESTWGKQIAAVVVTVSTLYAFTTVTSAIHSIGPNLSPCNNEPCYAIRIFPDSHECTTGGYYVSVQNGVGPVRVIKSNTTLFWRPWTMFEGWSIYEVGAFEETRPVSEVKSWLPFFYNLSWNVMFFVTRLTVKLTKFGLEILFCITGGSRKHVVWTFYCLDHGAQYFPPALCKETTPEEMRELCNNVQDRKESFQGIAANAFLLGLILWGLTMCWHDILLLRGHETGKTWPWGFLCLLCHCFTACAALWAAADGLGIFSATPEGHRDCVCHYQIDGIQALLLLGIPCLLVYRYIYFRKAFFLSIVCGDFLYNTMYRVPFAVVQSSPTWQRAPVLLPRHRVSLEQPLVKWKPNKDLLDSFRCCRIVDGLSRMCLVLSIGTLSTSLLPKAGQLLVSLLLDEEGSAAWRFVTSVGPGLALHVPAVALAAVAAIMLRFVDQEFSRSSLVHFIFRASGCGFASAILLLWPPDWSMLLGQISADDRHILGAAWSVSAVYIFYAVSLLYWTHSTSIGTTLDIACATYRALLEYKENGQFQPALLSLQNLRRRGSEEKEALALFHLEDLLHLVRDFPDGEDAWKDRLLQWLSDEDAVELESPERSIDRTRRESAPGEDVERSRGSDMATLS